MHRIGSCPGCTCTAQSQLQCTFPKLPLLQLEWLGWHPLERRAWFRMPMEAIDGLSQVRGEWCSALAGHSMHTCLLPIYLSLCPAIISPPQKA